MSCRRSPQRPFSVPSLPQCPADVSAVEELRAAYVHASPLGAAPPRQRQQHGRREQTIEGRRKSEGWVLRKRFVAPGPVASHPMTRLLITNDDGIDAPALLPLAKALRRLGWIDVVVPDRERSWISKAITRHEPIVVEQVSRDGLDLHTVSGYPADCVQIGVHNLNAAPPAMVVSGVNVGANSGSAFVSGSGTVGAAVEAANTGVPALAFSAHSVGEWTQWAPWALSVASLPMWERLAEVAADIVETVLTHGFPDGVDVLNVNMPGDADVATPRSVTPLAVTRYGRLFKLAEAAVMTHAFDGALEILGDPQGTDVATVASGHVAITPIRVATTAPIGEQLRQALETSQVDSA